MGRVFSVAIQLRMGDYLLRNPYVDVNLHPYGRKGIHTLWCGLRLILCTRFGLPLCRQHQREICDLTPQASHLLRPNRLRSHGEAGCGGYWILL